VAGIDDLEAAGLEPRPQLRGLAAQPDVPALAQALVLVRDVIDDDEVNRRDARGAPPRRAGPAGRATVVEHARDDDEVRPARTLRSPP